jgi:hypothetical protein
MTDTPPPASATVSATIGEIADLLAWARSLSAQGPLADPEQRAAFLTAKTQLLARITGSTYPTAEDGER